MEITTYGCGSCALSEIRLLSDGSTNARDAMALFCQKQLQNGERYSPRENRTYVLLAPIYIFVAGPEVKVGQPGSSHHSKDHWPKYGTEFAAFITEHKLGGLATLPPRLNLKYHPETTCQAWLWTPDQEAVEAWFTAHQKPGKEPKVKL